MARDGRCYRAGGSGPRSTQASPISCIPRRKRERSRANIGCSTDIPRMCRKRSVSCAHTKKPSCSGSMSTGIESSNGSSHSSSDSSSLLSACCPFSSMEEMRPNSFRRAVFFSASSVSCDGNALVEPARGLLLPSLSSSLDSSSLFLLLCIAIATLARRRRGADSEWWLVELKGLAITRGGRRPCPMRGGAARQSRTRLPAAPGTAGRADAGRGARPLCLINFIRWNKTVSRDCAKGCGGRGGPGRIGSCGPSAGRQVPTALKQRKAKAQVCDAATTCATCLDTISTCQLNNYAHTNKISSRYS